MKAISVLALAVLGTAAASIVSAVRAHQRAAKVQDKEDLQRWEAEGGNVPLKPVPPPVTRDDAVSH